LIPRSTSQLERPGDRTHCVLMERQRLSELSVRSNQCAADHVAVPTEVLVVECDSVGAEQ
jgi:hypothetical protein